MSSQTTNQKCHGCAEIIDISQDIHVHMELPGEGGGVVYCETCDQRFPALETWDHYVPCEPGVFAPGCESNVIWEVVQQSVT